MSVSSVVSSPPLAGVFTLLAALSAPVFPQGLRLNGPLPRAFPGGPIEGDVIGFGGEHLLLPPPANGLVVYVADQDVAGVDELYTARIDGGGPPHRLTASLGTSGDVTSYVGLSRDGAWVVFQHFTPAERIYRLYAVQTRGEAAPVLLDESLGHFSGPLAFGASDTRVVYRTERSGASRGNFQIYSVPLDGSEAATELRPPRPPWVTHRLSVGEHALTPDGSEVLFTANPERMGQSDLFAAPVDGSAIARRISADSQTVQGFSLAPDGSSVLYRTHDLFSVTLSGAPPRRLSNSRSVGRVGVFRFTPDGSTAVFVAPLPQPPSGHRLYSVPIEGRRPAVGVPAGPLRHEPVLLTPLPPDHDLSPGSLELTPDGAQALYLAGPAFGRYQLFRVRTDGRSAAVRIDPLPALDEELRGFRLAPDGEHVVVQAGPPSGPFELYGLPIRGGPAIDYGTRAFVSEIYRFLIAPDSSYLFYVGVTPGTDSLELHAVPLDGSKPARRINGPLPPGGDVLSSFVPLPRGRVLYRADQVADDVFELFEGFAGRAVPGPR